MRAPLTLTLLLAAALAALAAPAGAQEILEELPSVTLPPEGGDRVHARELDSLAGHDDLVVRQVGPVAIRASDVWRVMDLAAPQLSGDVVREMVLTTLAELEAKKEGVDVPSAEVERQLEAAIAEQKARFAMEGAPDMSLEDFLLTFHGMDGSAYRAETRRMVLASLLLDRVVRLHSLRSERDELQIILVDDEGVAREISQLLAEGASFAVLAKRHSIHPSGAEGGFMPPLSADLSVPLVDGRKMLAEGEVLGPAPITLGDKDMWRLVRLVERREAVEGDWASLRDLVEEDLVETPMNPDEVAVFEARMRELYRVQRPAVDGVAESAPAADALAREPDDPPR